jgi:hypothetical protein
MIWPAELAYKEALDTITRALQDSAVYEALEVRVLRWTSMVPLLGNLWLSWRQARKHLLALARREATDQEYLQAVGAVMIVSGALAITISFTESNIDG